MITALCWLFLASAAAWLGFLVHNLFDLQRTPRLGPRDGPPEVGSDPPLVSILVPARNEGSRILSDSLWSMLGQRYPRLEVVAVNDRSTDDTLVILRRLAADDPRLVVIDGTEPPEGWLGKVHALHQAAEAARGEWLVGTDADMIFHHDAVAWAVVTARERGADMVTLLPSGGHGDFGVDVVLPIAVWMILTLFPPRATNDPADPRALGCGGFLMVRRAALGRIGGYAAVADDIADDVGLAEALKRAGCQLFCAHAPELLYTPMYANLRELWDGFGKNSLRGVNHNIAKGLASLLSLFWVTVWHALVVLILGVWLACGGDPAWAPVLRAATIAWLAQAASCAPIYREYGVSPAYGVLAPFAYGFMGAVLASAIGRAVTGRTIAWRGREVPCARRRTPPRRGQIDETVETVDGEPNPRG